MEMQKLMRIYVHVTGVELNCDNYFCVIFVNRRFFVVVSNCLFK
jgi:hypothetical protein